MMMMMMTMTLTMTMTIATDETDRETEIYSHRDRGRYIVGLPKLQDHVITYSGKQGPSSKKPRGQITRLRV